MFDRETVIWHWGGMVNDNDTSYVDSYRTELIIYATTISPYDEY